MTQPGENIPFDVSETIPEIVKGDVGQVRAEYELGLYSDQEAATAFGALAQALGDATGKSPEGLQAAVDAARTMGYKGGSRKKPAGDSNE